MSRVKIKSPTQSELPDLLAAHLWRPHQRALTFEQLTCKAEKSPLCCIAAVLDPLNFIMSESEQVLISVKRETVAGF